MKLIISLTILISLTVFLSIHRVSKLMDNDDGLNHVISHYNAFEKKLIEQVIEKINVSDKWLNALTRIHLSKPINNENEYYLANRIVFFINPAIYIDGETINSIESIDTRWEDSNLIRHADGGIEFNVEDRKSANSLELTLYGVKDRYEYSKSVVNTSELINRIDQMFLSSKNTSVNHVVLNGMANLLINHQISIMKHSRTADQYTIKIERIDNDMLSEEHFYEEIDTVYLLQLNLEKNSIELLDKYSPTFYPTPASKPRPPTK